MKRADKGCGGKTERLASSVNRAGFAGARCKRRPHRYRPQSASRPRLAEGFAELNPARPMLGFRPRASTQTGFLTDDNVTCPTEKMYV